MGNEAKERHASSDKVQEVPKYEANIVLPMRKLQKKRSDVELSKLEKFEPRARKARLGDKITALQELVSPFGKSDTASVLLEAIGYIQFLLNQIEVLSTHEHNGSVRLAQNQGYGSLRSRGLCLVPVTKVTDSKDNFANFPLPIARPILKYVTPDSRKDENMQNQAKCAPFTSTTFSDETKLLEAVNDGENKPTNGLHGEITVLQQVSSPSSKVNAQSLTLTVPSKPVCDIIAIDIRPVNYAPELEATYMAKTVATDRTMMSFRTLALITVQLVMLVLLYLRSGPSVMDSRLLKLLKAYAFYVSHLQWMDTTFTILFNTM